MKRILLGIFCLLAWSNTAIAQPPLLKGEVKHLNGALVTNTPIRLLEPDINSTTDPDGVFKIQLSTKWKVGDQVTLRVQLKGHEVLRPWEGKITIQAEADKKLEPVIVAKDTLVRLVNNPAELERRILQPAFEAQARSRTQPEASPELDVLAQEARRLNVSLPELIALLNEWKKRAETRGTVYEKALAALYEKNYGDAIKLLTEDISADERDLARSDSLRNLLPRKYLNLGLAHAGKYEHAEAEQAYKKALALNPDFLGARMLLGYTYKFTGRLVEAMNLYRIDARRLRAEQDSSQRKLYASLLLEIGNILETQGNLDSALIHYRQSLSSNRYLKHHEGIASAFSNIGDVYQTRGKLDSALVYYRQALEINRRLQRPEGMANQLGNIGIVYKTQGKLDSALVYYRQALEINRRLQRPEGMANQLGNIGIVYKTQGKLDSALVYYRQALEINRRLQRPEGMASDLGNIGIVYKTQGKLDSALVYYRQALEINRRLQRPEGMANQLGNIGVVYQTQGKLDSALVYYRQSLAIERRLQRPEGMASDLGNIGIVYQTQGKLDSALVYYRQALEINRRLQRPEGMGIQFFNLGFLFENSAEFGLAAAHFDSAYSLFSAMGSPQAEDAQKARLRVIIKRDPFILGHSYLQNEKPAEALEVYRTALQSKPDSLQGYLFIAHVFSQTGPPDSVVANYRRALAKKPNYADALNGLAWHFALRNENLEEALTLSQRSLQVKPQEPHYWDTLAEIHFRMGRFSEAQTANENARRYAQDENVLKSIEERANKIEVALRR